MANYNQAPAIKYNGEKMKDTKKMGKAIRTHELEMALMCGLGAKDMAQLKIMLFLTGNAEGFQVAEKTICERCNISESGYKTARKKLEEKGWITLNKSKELVVNYNVIYKSLGITENTPLNDNQKSKGYTENTSMRYTEKSPQGYSENTHNNIKEYDKEQNKEAEINQPSVDVITFIEPEGEEEGTAENPIKVSKAWLVERYNEIFECRNGLFRYRGRYYTLQ